MKLARLILPLVLLALPALADPPTTQTKEVLVLTSATEILRTKNTSAVELQNLGPNAIYCAFGASGNAVVNKARKIEASGGVWSVEAPPAVRMWCICAVAQLTTAATVVSEARQ